MVKISKLKKHTSELGDELGDLRSEVDDFTWENWQSNVWDVESEMSDVESVFDNLQYEFLYKTENRTNFADFTIRADKP